MTPEQLGRFRELSALRKRENNPSDSDSMDMPLRRADFIAPRIGPSKQDLALARMAHRGLAEPMMKYETKNPR